MRILIVDRDCTMLEALAQALREHFTIDTATTGAACLDLLRHNEYDVVIACDEISNGSGLALLVQVARDWSTTLRILSAGRDQLKQLEGRLGALGLLATLAYPIEPRNLIATLRLADAAHQAEVDTTNIEHVVLAGDYPERTTPGAHRGAGHPVPWRSHTVVAEPAVTTDRTSKVGKRRISGATLLMCAVFVGTLGAAAVAVMHFNKEQSLVQSAEIGAARAHPPRR